MKHDNSYEARASAARLLQSQGVDLTKHGTYDCESDGRRYSASLGRVTAIWDDAHFKTWPFGEHPARLVKKR
jgi:hypothetical protein